MPFVRMNLGVKPFTGLKVNANYNGHHRQGNFRFRAFTVGKIVTVQAGITYGNVLYFYGQMFCSPSFQRSGSGVPVNKRVLKRGHGIAVMTGGNRCQYASALVGIKIFEH